ncbi:MAG: hypothetical protein MJE68_25315 [Proteobacteria bacterium]|nr:hypothetical protein [Pseudomonadota bacterium]
MLDVTGTRIYPIVRIKQYRFEGKVNVHNNISYAWRSSLIVLGISLIRKDIAFVEQQKNGSISFKFLKGIDDGVIYPSKLKVI